MSITFPRADILSLTSFATQKFSLDERQELSRQANGVTRAKSFGSALWSTELSTTPLPLAASIDFEAVLHSLDGAVQPFHFGDLRRPYPASNPTGNFDETGVAIHTIGGDGKSLKIDGLPAGFVLSRGDYLAFNYGSGPSRALHQVMETATADGGGLSPLFEVRPHLRPGAAVNAVVALKKPTAQFLLVPGSVQSAMQGPLTAVVSFSAVQFL